MAELIRLSRGVWRAPEQVTELADRCAALLTVLPPSTVVSGPTAAALRGTWLPSRLAGVIEVTIPGEDRLPRHTTPSRRPELRVRRRTLLADEVGLAAGLPATTPARTWVDLAEQLRPPELIAAGDWTLRDGVTPDELNRLLVRAHRRRGVVRARACVPLLNARSRSLPESHLRAELVLAGLPTPDVNEAVTDGNGGWLAEPDLSYLDARLALEYQGSEHAKVPRMRRDMTRGIDLGRWGWLVVPVGPAEVFRYPDRIVALVRSLLYTRTPRAASRRIG